MSEEEIRKISEQEGFVKYFETSALFGDNLKPLFDEVISQVINIEDKSNKGSPNGADNKKKKKKKKDDNDEEDKKCIVF